MSTRWIARPLPQALALWCLALLASSGRALAQSPDDDGGVPVCAEDELLCFGTCCTPGSVCGSGDDGCTLGECCEPQGTVDPAAPAAPPPSGMQAEAPQNPPAPAAEMEPPAAALEPACAPDQYQCAPGGGCCPLGTICGAPNGACPEALCCGADAAPPTAPTIVPSIDSTRDRVPVDCCDPDDPCDLAGNDVCDCSQQAWDATECYSLGCSVLMPDGTVRAPSQHGDSPYVALLLAAAGLFYSRTRARRVLGAGEQGL